MGALDEKHMNLVLEKGVKPACVELGFEHEPETISIQNAVKVLLEGLSEDTSRQGIIKTPYRVAKALREGTRGYKLQVKDIVESALFPEAGLDSEVGQAGGVGGLVVVRDLDHYSYCESCLQPFHFKCHVGYVPAGQRVLGLSKFSRVTDVFAKRLQEPQRLADEICSALQHWIEPSGVAVVLQCSHIHFPSIESGIFDENHHGFVDLLVSSGSGAFENEDADIWSEFRSLLTFKGIKLEQTCRNGSTNETWCPSAKTSDKFASADTSMVSALGSILKSLGEDPSRKELMGTPCRFLKWMMNFQNADLEMKLNGFVDGISHVKSNGEVKERLHCEPSVPFWSMCEHHLLPFYGVAHVGYFCVDGVDPIGKSLIQSIVHFYGFKLQVQERLTRQIAETLSPILGGDVIVVVEAGHTCMISRGIEKFGSSTATIAVLGKFATDVAARALFLDRIQKTG